MPLDNSPVAIERKKKVTKCEACFYPSIKCDLNSVYGQVVLPLRFLMLSMLDKKQVSTGNKTNPVTSSTLGGSFRKPRKAFTFIIVMFWIQVQ